MSRRRRLRSLTSYTRLTTVRIGLEIPRPFVHNLRAEIIEGLHDCEMINRLSAAIRTRLYRSHSV